MTANGAEHGGKRRCAVRQAAAAAMALAVVSPVEAQERASVAPENMQTIAPGLAEYTDAVLYGDLWRRTELSPRDRSHVTLSVLIAAGKMAQLGGHVGRGLDNGIKPTEIAGIVTHLAFYTGWPNAVSALNVIEQAFADRKIDASALRPGLGRTAPPPASDQQRAKSVEERIAPAAPKLAELTNEVLFADLWQRNDLAPRDRSLITIAALAANGDLDDLGFHLRRSLENGLTEAEVGEAITHIAFYAGWPKAMAAAEVASTLFDTRRNAMSLSEPDLQIVPAGQSPNAGPPAYFTGSVAVTSTFKGTGEARLAGGTVTFQPGAYTNWHTHPLGQLLIFTQGSGWVQVSGEPARAIKTGATVWIAPGVKHWHGAARDSTMTHVAVSEALDGTSVTWLEPLTNAQYNKLR